MRNERGAIGRELKTQSRILVGAIALMWLLELSDLFVFGGSLNRYGIRPRNLSGLWGILFAPWLHGSLGHLIANSIPFLILGWFVMLRETSDFWIVTTITMLVGGLGVWLFGGVNTIHLGASSLIFGYLGYLLLRGYFERSFASILVAVIVGSLYGSIIWGILPAQPGISWQGHLFGFLGGVLAARLSARRSLPRKQRKLEDWR